MRSPDGCMAFRSSFIPGSLYVYDDQCDDDETCDHDACHEKDVDESEIGALITTFLYIHRQGECEGARKVRPYVADTHRVSD